MLDGEHIDKVTVYCACLVLGGQYVTSYPDQLKVRKV